jgi:hypothetical protein
LLQRFGRHLSHARKAIILGTWKRLAVCSKNAVILIAYKISVADMLSVSRNLFRIQAATGPETS